MTRHKAIVKSKKHWIKMCKWVSKQNKDDDIDDFKMRKHIHENWSGNYCALCNYERDCYLDVMFRKHCDSYARCDECPLTVIGEGCIATDSVWRRVRLAPTWGRWLKKAENMILALEFLEAFEPTWEI